MPWLVGLVYFDQSHVWCCATDICWLLGQRCPLKISTKCTLTTITFFCFILCASNLVFLFLHMYCSQGCSPHLLFGYKKPRSWHPVGQTVETKVWKPLSYSKSVLVAGLAHASQSQGSCYLLWSEFTVQAANPHHVFDYNSVLISFNWDTYGNKKSMGLWREAGTGKTLFNLNLWAPLSTAPAHLGITKCPPHPYFFIQSNMEES